MPVAPAARPASEAELSVLTQNAWGGVPLWDHRCETLAKTIRGLRPAVIGLQEIHAGSAEEGRSQASEIAHLAAGYRAWFAPGRVTATGACEGVALLCREDIEVIERSIEALTLDRTDPFEGEHQRIVLRAAIRWDGAVIDVLVTHLSLSRRARTRTVRELLSFAERERERSGSVGAVLMGDFNAPPSEEAIARVWHRDHLAGRVPAAADRLHLRPARRPLDRDPLRSAALLRLGPPRGDGLSGSAPGNVSEAAPEPQGFAMTLWLASNGATSVSSAFPFPLRLARNDRARSALPSPPLSIHATAIPSWNGFSDCH
jgi:endonuclease/exonuclease/phosphatase family metal-dependent hydrolase